MRELYLLSGLGADKRVFDFIDLSGYKLIHMEWIAPLPNESMSNYAVRLLPQICSTRPMLIGVSFGGMMAVEIGKLIETEKLILLSSAKSKLEIPIYFKILGTLGIHHLIPVSLFKCVNRLTYWFFGVTTDSEKSLLKDIIQSTDEKFLRWAIDKIVCWNNTTIPKNIIHIHGTNDRILPLKNATTTFQNGGHLMILNQGDRLSKLIKTALAESP
jgi:hypothetical protein